NKILSLLTSPIDVHPNFESIIERLEEYSGTYNWMPNLINKLQNSSQRIKNSFVYNTMHGLKMNFVMYSENRKTNKKSLKVYKTNSNEITVNILSKWNQNLISSPLIQEVDGEYVINKDV